MRALNFFLVSVSFTTCRCATDDENYLYVPPSFCLSITEWNPTFLLHFDAQRTNSNDAASVATYIAAYASCYNLKTVNVLMPQNETSWNMACKGDNCFSKPLSVADIAVQKTTDTYLMGRFSAVFGLMEANTDDREKTIKLVTNIRCSDIIHYPDLGELVKYFSETKTVLSSTKSTLNIAWITTDADFSACQPAKTLKQIEGVNVTRIHDVAGLQAMLPDSCQRPKSKPPSDHILQLALEIGIPLVVLTAALSGGIYWVRRRRHLKLRKAAKIEPKLEWDTDNEADDAEKNPLAIDLRYLDVTEIKLGSGAFAAVYKGYYSVPTSPTDDKTPDTPKSIEPEKLEVAVKVLHPRNAVKHRDDVLREIEIMEQLGDNAHVLQLIGHSMLNDTPILVLEYCDKGCLLNYLRWVLLDHKKTVTDLKDDLQYRSYQNTRLTLKDLIGFAWQISDGMISFAHGFPKSRTTFLASKGFIHRDLAARNILLTADNVAKIADFGLCRLSDEELYTIQRETKLPVKWMAPECFTKGQFSTQSDVWSYGVLLYEIFSAGSVPYEFVEPADMPRFLRKGNRLEQPILCPLDIYRLMVHCWESSPEKRPTFPAIQSYFAKCLEHLREEYGYISVSMRSDGSYLIPRTMAVLK